MTRIKYDSNLIEFMKIFEAVTHAKLKDCITNDYIIFVVEENEIGKAIGKKGVNVRRLEQMLNKKVKIVEFSSDVKQFIKNFVMPIQVSLVEEQDNILTVRGSDTKTRGLLIGREGKNLDTLKDTVRRYFQFDDIKVA